VEQILHTALAAINAHLHYANVALLLVDPEEPSLLVLRARSGIYAELAPPHYRQSINDGVIGAAARNQQTVLVADVQRDPRYIAVPGIAGIQAELAVPLVTARRLVGVLNIESRRPIPADAIADLEIIADQLSAAIDNANRFQEEKRRTERLELIARVGQRIAARLDPHELFTTTIQELYTQLGYDHVAFFVLDPAAPTWLEQRAYASRWPAAGRIGYRQSIMQGVIGAAARKRTPELVNLTTADPRYIPVSATDDMRAELAIPILSGEQLLGIFDIGSRKPFREADVKALQIITDQLAVAMEQSSLFARTQRALDETALLYETSQRISAALDVANVVQAYLEQVAGRGQYACHIALYELDEAGQRRSVIVYGRWTPKDGLDCPLELKIPYTRDALDEPLDAGKTVTISDVHTDPRVSQTLRDMQTRDGRPALAMIPLIGRNQRIGLVILSYPAIHEWPTDQLHLYQITAAQLATAIDGHLQRSLTAKHDQQLAVLEERRRLARDLHDSVTQLLFSITLIAQSLGSAWRRNPAEGEQRIQRLLELSQAALAEMRALLVELRPTDELFQLQNAPPLPWGVQVQKFGLVVALRSYLASIREYGLRIHTETTEYHRQAADQEEVLFRIIQEALNNIVKHARATQVQITLAIRNRMVRLRVQDNGVGFVSPLAADFAGGSSSGQGGMGLQTMRERTAALGGAFTLNTTPGQGVTVEVVAPVAGAV
jgi:signal transduction histidine kinase/putative methionine-R-sulfoxide reductase with GAF domain